MGIPSKLQRRVAASPWTPALHKECTKPFFGSTLDQRPGTKTTPNRVCIDSLACKPLVPTKEPQKQKKVPTLKKTMQPHPKRPSRVMEGLCRAPLRGRERHGHVRRVAQQLPGAPKTVRVRFKGLVPPRGQNKGHSLEHHVLFINSLVNSSKDSTVYP